MQFNYQNVKTEEEYPSDYRNYGLLNNSLIDDEISYGDNKIQDLEKKIDELHEENQILKRQGKSI